MHLNCGMKNKNRSPVAQTNLMNEFIEQFQEYISLSFVSYSVCDAHLGDANIMQPNMVANLHLVRHQWCIVALVNLVWRQLQERTVQIPRQRNYQLSIPICIYWPICPRTCSIDGSQIYRKWIARIWFDCRTQSIILLIEKIILTWLSLDILRTNRLHVLVVHTPKIRIFHGQRRTMATAAGIRRQIFLSLFHSREYSRPTTKCLLTTALAVRRPMDAYQWGIMCTVGLFGNSTQCLAPV